jgi:hypothetical protein
MVPPEGVEVDAFQRWQILDIGTGESVEGPRRTTAGAGIDEDHLSGATHTKGDIHAAGATVGDLGARRQSAVEQSAHQDRADCVVTP